MYTKKLLWYNILQWFFKYSKTALAVPISKLMGPNGTEVFLNSRIDMSKVYQKMVAILVGLVTLNNSAILVMWSFMFCFVFCFFVFLFFSGGVFHFTPSVQKLSEIVEYFGGYSSSSETPYQNFILRKVSSIRDPENPSSRGMRLWEKRGPTNSVFINVTKKGNAFIFMYKDLRGASLAPLSIWNTAPLKWPHRITQGVKIQSSQNTFYMSNYSSLLVDCKNVSLFLFLVLQDP